MQPPIARASWIWHPSPTPDQYVLFRKSFTLGEVAAGAFIDVSVDTDFVGYLNGKEFGRGQFSDFPARKTWDRFQVESLLRPGRNVLAIMAFYKGENFFDYKIGTAGLLLRLESGRDEVLGDASWKVLLHPAFVSGKKDRVTNQMGFTFDYDARRESDWSGIELDDAKWASAQVVQDSGIGQVWRELVQRPLPKLEIHALTPVRLAGQGSFARLEKKERTAEAMAASALTAEFPWRVFANPELKAAFSAPAEGEAGKVEKYIGAPPNGGALLAGDAGLELRPVRDGAAGRYIIFDLGAETVGLLEFSIEASDGTLLEIAHGEHLDDGRVRSYIEGRCFADKYMCREGRQHFQMPFRRLGCRYIQIHASNYTRLKIHRIGLRPVEYPGQRLGSFEAVDGFSTRIHEVAVRTLELCRHEHYEDCPWREQGLYAYDSRLQALYGYYAFGDYRFPEVSFDLLGHSIDESGFVALTAPGWADVNIPIFSFSWIVAVTEHALFSGRFVLFDKFRAAMERILTDALARRDVATGLYYPPEDSRYWHFYEWVPGLCGAIGESKLHGALHAGYNLHLHEAMRVWLTLESSPEMAERLRQLGADIHRGFWDEQGGCYCSERSVEGKGRGRHELIQALALHEGVARNRERTVESLISGRLTRCSLSAIYYVLRATLDETPASRAWIMERLASIWGKMIARGATSMWETENGGDDFDFAGSLCHGWSSLPVWFHQAVVLGVRPLTRGFGKFTLAIHPASQRQASGTIPTPHGLIRVAWEMSQEGLVIEVTGPEECVPVLQPFPEGPVARATYNGAILKMA